MKYHRILEDGSTDNICKIISFIIYYTEYFLYLYEQYLSGNRFFLFKLYDNY